jgi:hypothetical protein
VIDEFRARWTTTSTHRARSGVFDANNRQPRHRRATTEQAGLVATIVMLAGVAIDVGVSASVDGDIGALVLARRRTEARDFARRRDRAELTVAASSSKTARAAPPGTDDPPGRACAEIRRGATRGPSGDVGQQVEGRPGPCRLLLAGTRAARLWLSSDTGSAHPRRDADRDINVKIRRVPGRGGPQADQAPQGCRVRRAPARSARRRLRCPPRSRWRWKG